MLYSLSSSVGQTMNRVTNENFKETYPHVERALKNASFIAIDAEFSGLISSTGEEPSRTRLDSFLFNLFYFFRSLSEIVIVSLHIVAVYSTRRGSVTPN